MPHKSEQIRALADCDSFFASCEVARNPSLKGKCVCIGKEGDIITASTYEAKARGIKTGTPSREAKRLLGDDLVLIAPDMKFYGQMSQKIFSCLAEYVDQLEQYSVDEAFVALPSSFVEDEMTATLYVDYIQQKLYQRTGIPVTFGVGPTRLLAKTFAKLGKPFGIYVALKHRHIATTVKRLELTKTPFIGERMAARVPMCRTIYDFMRLDGTVVREKLGRPGMKLRLELNGINAMSIERAGPQKIISRCRSFHPHFTNDKHFLRISLIKNFEKAYHQMMDQDSAVKWIKVYLKTKEFTKRKVIRRLPRATADKQRLLDLLRELFEQTYTDEHVYRTTGVVFAELETLPYKQRSVLDYQEEMIVANQKKVLDAMDLINRKRGGQIISTASNKETIWSGRELEVSGIAV